MSESHVQREDGRWRFAVPEAVIRLVRETFAQGKSDDEIGQEGEPLLGQGQ